MDTNQALKILSISHPFTKAKVLKQFRSWVKEIHPDTGRTDGGFYFTDMDDLVKAKELLLKLASEDENTGILTLRTSSGELLSELGNGLPNNKSGMTCTYCIGNGYNKRVMPRWVKCNVCNSRNDFMKYGSYSVFDPLGLISCRKCHGLGEVKSAKYDIIYGKCSYCKGTGEIEVFNPLIPKMRL